MSHLGIFSIPVSGRSNLMRQCGRKHNERYDSTRYTGTVQGYQGTQNWFGCKPGV
jgi:hypothetical protein